MSLSSATLTFDKQVVVFLIILYYDAHSFTRRIEVEDVLDVIASHSVLKGDLVSFVPDPVIHNAKPTNINTRQRAHLKRKYTSRSISR